MRRKLQKQEKRIEDVRCGDFSALIIMLMDADSVPTHSFHKYQSECLAVWGKFYFGRNYYGLLREVFRRTHTHTQRYKY